MLKGKYDGDRVLEAKRRAGIEVERGEEEG